ncbi:MAG: STAS domain-containing protein [Gemmatimonadota bacterium]|nr:STAS domain-containing protein [Gemmatimonadota bacterium]
MSATHTLTRRIAAPAVLGLDTRSDFLTQATGLLEEMPDGAGALLVDFANTMSVDSAGLGALMLVQRRAAERRQAVVLQQMSDELRFLLTLTKLDDLFEFQAAPRRR